MQHLGAEITKPPGQMHQIFVLVYLTVLLGIFRPHHYISRHVSTCFCETYGSKGSSLKEQEISVSLV